MLREHLHTNRSRTDREPESNADFGLSKVLPERKRLPASESYTILSSGCGKFLVLLTDIS